ncbi:sensor domain-containing diguanylate cyclase [Vibrio sonorensis]|uniref:sensor domain-containing diguanylate cyclase n=1 Tax=Vibrio sonorensis TaxID=1004316 RepID=UPI0008DAF1E4|nr:diguanylate cyclase [Vibrio sonorensis]
MFKRNNIFINLIAVTVALASIVCAYYLHKRQALITQAIDNTAHQALHQLTYSEREYLNLSRQFASVIGLLSHGHSLFDYVKQPSIENRAIVEEIWSSMAVNQKWYSQIRFIDLNGDEKIRVLYERAEKAAKPEFDYGNKYQREYFRYAQTLKKEQIGSWGIDLEKRDRTPILPYKPALRLLTPVEVDGKRFGYLVLNVDVWYLSSRLNYSPDEDFIPEVVSENGFYLASSDTSKLFGHMIEQRQEHNMSSRFPLAWKMMKDKKSGYLIEADHLVVFNRMLISPEQRLKMVISLSKEEVLQRAERDFQDLYQQATLVLLLGLVFVLPITSAVFYYRRRSIESQLARAALSGMSAVMISDRLHRTVMVNDEFTKLTEYNHRQTSSRNAIKMLLGEGQLDKLVEIFEHLSKEHLWEGEVDIITRGSHHVTAIMRVQSVMSSSGKVSYYITSLVDITDRKELEERLRVLSERDDLTQLWNRRKFEEELRKFSKLVERYPYSGNICLAILDIDHFKRINDEKGHDEGDRVIHRVGQIMTKTLRETDFIARIGGEEFAIIMPNTSIGEADLALNRLRIAVEIESDLSVTISAGFTDLTPDSTRCYKCADIALYEAKTLGRNQISLCRSTDEVA